MFVSYSLIPAQNLGEWSDRRRFRELFSELTGGRRGGAVVVDGETVKEGTTFSVNSEVAYMFYAKDKNTLVDGLKTVPQSVRAKELSGHSLGFFVGAYDWEKLGGWSRAQRKGTRKWNEQFSIQVEKKDAPGLTESQGDQLIRAGITIQDVRQEMNRSRLGQRGYFVIVGRSAALNGVRRKVGMLASELALSALGAMVGNGVKMSHEDALENLVEGINLA